ncbi:MAG: DUF1538 domain-containing protein [Ruminococcaceae bacterium]|nr:DUF1538 domain-containing protein [Oscillospiraceae bacterium]
MAGFGVGSFLVIAILRIVFKRRLSNFLMFFYMLLFSLALLLSVNENLDLLPMSFDSGGVAREKEAAFFGITIHAEKEILMLVVEKKIRDEVLHAIYQQMGMQQKAQSIVFALPVSDVAGLAPAVDTQANNSDEK